LPARGLELRAGFVARAMERAVRRDAGRTARNVGGQYRFLGNEDDGGLMDFGARFYDPRVGRFISPDPIQDISSSRSVNPYVYCANNPLRYTDKFGLSHERPEWNVGADDGGRRGDPTYHLVWDPFTGYLNFVRTADYGNIIIFRHCSFEVEGAMLDQVGFIRECEADYKRLLADHNFAMVLQAEKAKQEAAERRLRAARFGDVSDVCGLILYEYDVPGSGLAKISGEKESEKLIQEGALKGEKYIALGIYADFATSMVAYYRNALEAGGASFEKGAVIVHTYFKLDPITGERIKGTEKLGKLGTKSWHEFFVKVSNPEGADWTVAGCWPGKFFIELINVWSPVRVYEVQPDIMPSEEVSPKHGWQEIRRNFLGY
jgi:RHS repeat-associated protein